jgi:phosphatidylethanolamine-binding protein (PEBP) family uncharacterized protein
MKVLYNSSKIKNREFLSILSTHTQPAIDFKSDANKYYTLIMRDPDAVLGHRVHWLVINIHGNNIQSGFPVFPYLGPAPPPHSGTHHYIFEIYLHDIPDIYEHDIQQELSKKYSNRYIPLKTLKTILHLNHPLHTIYFRIDTGRKQINRIKSLNSIKRTNSLKHTNSIKHTSTNKNQNKKFNKSKKRNQRKGIK